MGQSQRQAGALEEIEITPEMVQAGRAIYHEWQAGADFREDLMVARIFLAMYEKRPRLLASRD